MTYSARAIQCSICDSSKVSPENPSLLCNILMKVIFYTLFLDIFRVGIPYDLHYEKSTNDLGLHRTPSWKKVKNFGHIQGKLGYIQGVS